MLGTILIVVLILLLIGAFPTSGYGFTAFGPYGSQSVLGVILIVVVILFLTGHI